MLYIHAKRGFEDEDRARLRELAARGFPVRAPDWQTANMIERWPGRHHPESEDDVEAGLNAVLARKDVYKGPVGIVALSRGPYFAIRVAAKRPQDIAAIETGSASASATCTASGGNAAGGALEEHIIRAITFVKIAAKPRAGDSGGDRRSKEAAMVQSTDPIQGRESEPDPRFRHAPPEWTPAAAQEIAQREHLALTGDHWEVIRALQEFYARHEDAPITLTDLHDALEEKFHYKGGIKYLYTVLPGGPIAQGCRLAGLKPPGGAIDTSFGSVA